MTLALYLRMKMWKPNICEENSPVNTKTLQGVDKTQQNPQQHFNTALWTVYTDIYHHWLGVSPVAAIYVEHHYTSWTRVRLLKSWTVKGKYLEIKKVKQILFMVFQQTFYSLLQVFINCFLDPFTLTISASSVF